MPSHRGLTGRATAQPSIPIRAQDQVLAANATGRTAAVFTPSLWLLPSSWARWAVVFEDAGYAPVVLRWPNDPSTMNQANATGLTLRRPVAWIVDHFAEIVEHFDRKPVLLGHSFGGLLAQLVAARGLSAATVAIVPAPSCGALRLPVSALKTVGPALGNTPNDDSAVPLTYDEFRQAFASVVDEAEAHRLYKEFAVPTSSTSVLQAATLELDPWTQPSVDYQSPERGPLLIVSGERDGTVPPSITAATFHEQSRNPGVTETIMMANRSHGLVIDHGWREVCDISLTFIDRFARAEAQR